MSIPAEPTPVRDAMEEPSAVEIAIIERLAALDDRLAGHTSQEAEAFRHGDHPSAVVDAGDDPANLTVAVDTILLLRQVAASERDSSYEPIVLPQHIGRYEIVREAGRGAFAYVLEASDEILHRRVALKVARPEALVSAPFRRRFIREAELAARLIHANIVAIHEVGEEAGLVFIANEYCAGGDLAAWLERQSSPMPPRQAAEIVRALATAAAYAHANGIVHRDIKPANVLLVPPPGQAVAGGGDASITDMTVKLGDFGLGKLFHDQAEDDFTQLTRTGARLGTPAWMAPEQIDRSFGEVGPATDIHALGLLLDRLLTGRCLYGGKTEAETFRAVLLEEPTAADSVARHVPRDLAAVCLKCVAKRPVDRYASAADLAADLSRFLENTPTLARPRSGLSSMARSVARRPLLFFLAVAAVGGLLLATWAALERSREARRHSESQAEIGRLEAAAELRRGFEAWRTGNAASAIDHLRACQTIDADLTGSLAGRWLLARLHGENDLLLSPDAANPHHPDLYCFTYARDGRTMAAGGADGRLLILRLEADGAAAGQPLVIDAHDEVNDVAFSPDGRQVASAGEDGRLCIWNVADGSMDREVHRAKGPLFAVAFSLDGDWLACGGAQQRLCLLPTGVGEDPRELQPFAEAVAAGSVSADADVESLQFVDDDRIAVACGRMVAVLDLQGGIVRIFPGHDGTVGQLSLSRDGRRLLSGGTDREPRVWDIATGQLVVTLPRHPSWVQGCDFSPDGSSIVTGCRDGVIRIFDAATGAEQRKLAGHLGRTWDVKYSPSGMPTSAGADGTLRRWSLGSAADALGMREVRIPSAIHSADFGRGQRCAVGIVESRPGMKTALVNLRNRTVIVDMTNGRLTEIPSPSSTSSYSIAVDGLRRRFAAAPLRGPIEVLPLPPATGFDDGSTNRTAEFKRLRGIPESVTKDVVWTPSGMLIAGGDGGMLLAWDPALDEAVVVDRLERTVDAVRLAPAGSARLAIAAGDLVRVYPVPAAGPPQASGAKTVAALPPATGWMARLAWSPDGTALAYGTSDGQVATVDATSGAVIKTFAKHSRELVGIVWSSDGRTLVTADAECVRFSDAFTTMTLDEVRPGWAIEDMKLGDSAHDGVSPVLVIAGSAATASDGSGREARIGIFDLHRTLPPKRGQP